MENVLRVELKCNGAELEFEDSHSRRINLKRVFLEPGIVVVSVVFLEVFVKSGDHQVLFFRTQIVYELSLVIQNVIGVHFVALKFIILRNFGKQTQIIYNALDLSDSESTSQTVDCGGSVISSHDQLCDHRIVINAYQVSSLHTLIDSKSITLIGETQIRQDST